MKCTAEIIDASGTILVTGFENSMDYPRNVSGEMVRSIDGRTVEGDGMS